MRHGKKFNHLGRKTAHRKAMLANMACSLIEHKRINTTVAKAKALRQFIEPLITKSKAENNVTAEKGTHNRRIVFKNLRNKYAVTELFSAVSEKIGDRPGGYTRIIKLGNRLGDNADMAMIELVDFNELYNAGKPKKKSTRRSRRGGAKKEDSKVAETTEEKTSLEGAETTNSSSGVANSEESQVQDKAKAKKAEGDSVEAEATETKATETKATETKASEAEAQETEAQETESQDAKADVGDNKASEDAKAVKSEKPEVDAEADDTKAPEAKGNEAGEEAEPKKDDTK